LHTPASNLQRNKTKKQPKEHSSCAPKSTPEATDSAAIKPPNLSTNKQLCRTHQISNSDTIHSSLGLFIHILLLGFQDHYIFSSNYMVNKTYISITITTLD